ncbi:MAG: hypothetical protein ABS920_11720 [Sporosarcina sp.]
MAKIAVEKPFSGVKTALGEKGHEVTMFEQMKMFQDMTSVS